MPGNIVEGEPRFAHLSNVHPEWEKVAPSYRAVEQKINELYSLPIDEFRQIPYRPPPIPAASPVVGTDINIRENEIVVRDGAKVGIRIYQPVVLGKGHMLFFNVHGGGWTVGTPETEEGQNRLIAARSRVVVVSVDYRKAPEFPFPYALNDSLDALLWCQNNADSLAVNPQRIVVGGGSAGATICTVLTHLARDNNIAGIIGQILNIPVTCHPKHFPAEKYEYHSYAQNADAPMVSAVRMRQYWNNYLPGEEEDPRASPLLAASLAGLPPTLVQVAGMDPLRDEGLAYAEALRNSGVDVTLKIYPGMPHAFYAFPELEPSVRYFEAMVEWIDQLGGRDGGSEQ